MHIHGFGGPSMMGGFPMGGADPMQMVLQILMQLLTGMMGGGNQGCGGMPFQGQSPFSTGMNPGFGLPRNEFRLWMWRTLLLPYRKFPG